VNGAVITLAKGPDGYGTHKWLALALWVLAPFVLARLIEVIPSKQHWKVVAAGGLASVSAATCWAATGAVAHIVPPELMALRNDERLEAADVVNIDLGNQYENSIAALVIDGPTVVAGTSYAAPTPMEGDWLLIRASAAADTPADEVVPLNDAFVLVDTAFEIGVGEVRFDQSEPWTQMLLLGGWHQIGESGTWSSAARASLAFDVADELRGRDLVLTLTGTRYASADDPRTLTVVVVGAPSASATFAAGFEPKETTVVVPADVVDAAGGRVFVELRTPDLVSPSAFGSADTRELGYCLIALSVSPA
jgi:hypothetical protein